MDELAEPVESATLRRVVDELEIRNTLARLAQVADMASTDELDQYLALWTEDGTWVLLPGPLYPAEERKGHADLRAAATERRQAGRQGPGANSRHVISTDVIDFETPDRATARSYFQIYRDTLTTSPRLGGMG